MADLVEGDAFFAHPRPRRRCEDCGRRVSWGSLGDLVDRVDFETLRRFARFVPEGGSVYWCSCGLVGAFSSAFKG